MDAAGDTLALAEEDHSTYDTASLQFFDVRDPASPQLSGTFAAGYIGESPVVSLSGDRVYLAVQGGRLIALDISNPTDAHVVGEFHRPVYDLEARRGLVYVAAGPQGFFIVHGSGPADPVERGALPGLGRAVDAAALGPQVYVADAGVKGYVTFYRDSALAVVSADLPQTPQVKARTGLMCQNAPSRVAVDGQHAYLTGGNCTLRYIDCLRRFHLHAGWFAIA